jgi:hypothetical protein
MYFNLGVKTTNESYVNNGPLVQGNYVNKNEKIEQDRS